LAIYRGPITLLLTRLGAYLVGTSKVILLKPTCRVSKIKNPEESQVFPRLFFQTPWKQLLEISFKVRTSLFLLGFLQRPGILATTGGIV